MFNQIINEVEDKIEIKDHEIKYYMINDAALIDYDTTREKITGKSMFDFFPEEVAREYHELELDIIQSKVGRYSLEKVELKNHFKYLFINKTPIFLPEKESWGLLVIQREVSKIQVENDSYIQKLQTRYHGISIKL